MEATYCLELGFLYKRIWILCVYRPRKEKTGARRGRPRKKDVVKQEDVEEDKEETEVSYLVYYVKSF